MDNRELVVLQEFGRDPTTSQRALATRLGVALGLTNAIIKRIARRGLIKIRRFKPNRLGYYLTPEGIHARGKLVLSRIKETVEFYRDARAKAGQRCTMLKEQGIHRVALYGISELAEILFLAMRETGIEVSYVIEERAAAGRWLGLRVYRDAAPPSRNSIDAVVMSFAAGTGAQADIERRFSVPVIDATSWFHEL